MADLRYDPLTGVWVAIAQHRVQRPIELISVDSKPKPLVCPFCPGNESQTPHAIAVFRGDGTIAPEDPVVSNWMLRVIPNKFPSLSQSEANLTCGPYECFAGDGLQELVIPTPRHVSSLSHLSQQEMLICLAACQQRVAVMRNESGIEHITLFMNCRSAAGATLEHIHLQIAGSPLLNDYLLHRNRRNDINMERNGESLLATLLHWELEQGERIVAQTERFVMLCPYASRFSFQVWIMPRSSDSVFERCSPDDNREIADLCQRYVRRLEQIHDQPAYNLLLQLAPNRHQENEHWLLELFPRFNHIAGYEIGTNIWVNPTSPEEAARCLCLSDSP